MVLLETAQDTHSFGRRLASLLRPGDLVVLTGPLGAGKTALTQGIGSGLGVSGRVVSPTFVIARVHQGGRIPLVHVDAYRLHSLDEVDEMDFDVAMADSVTVVEWGAGLVEQLADARLELTISREPDSEVRQVSLRAVGGDWSDRIGTLMSEPVDG
jgi:tRNA threonylcarbamoyladenosine biosynthesis protein TsaE